MADIRTLSIRVAGRLGLYERKLRCLYTFLQSTSPPMRQSNGPFLASVPVFHDQLDGAEERVCLPKDLCESPLPASAERERERAASHTSKFQQATYAGSLTIDVIALGIKTQLKLNSTQLMSQVERGTLHWERYASRCLRSSLPVITPRTRTSD